MNGMYMVLASTTEVATHGTGVSANLVGYLFSILNILILFYLLKLILFKPITRILNNRTEKIQKNIDEAKQVKEEAETLKKEYSQKMDGAKREVQDIINTARQSAQSQAEKIINDAKDKAQKIVERAHEQAEIEMNNALTDAKEKIASLALEAASKVIKSNMDNEANRKIVEEFIDEVGAA